MYARASTNRMWQECFCLFAKHVQRTSLVRVTLFTCAHDCHGVTFGCLWHDLDFACDGHRVTVGSRSRVGHAGEQFFLLKVTSSKVRLHFLALNCPGASFGCSNAIWAPTCDVRWAAVTCRHMAMLENSLSSWNVTSSSGCANDSHLSLWRYLARLMPSCAVGQSFSVLLASFEGGISRRPLPYRR